jgi:hypothetical protein
MAWSKTYQQLHIQYTVRKTTALADTVQMPLHLLMPVQAWLDVQEKSSCLDGLME